MPCLFRLISLFTLALFSLTFLLPLGQKGMFLDGVTYAAISKNLSMQQGKLWDLFYTPEVFPHFFEHPPFVFWLQSKLFSLFGPSFPAEQLYNLILILLQLTSMAYFWVTRLKQSKASLCILFVFWLMVPLNHLYTSNLLEGSLSFFCCLAGFLLLRSNPTVHFDLIGASVLIVLGILSNGPTALYPLAIPFLKPQGFFNKIKEVFILITFIAFIFIIIDINQPKLIEAFKQYLSIQLFPSLQGNRGGVNHVLSHLLILKYLLRASWMPIIVSMGLIYWSMQQRNGKLSFYALPVQTKLMLFIALIASLPVGFSPRQNFNYIMQAGPWLSLFFAQLNLTAIEELRKKISISKRLEVFAWVVLILALSLTVLQWGKFRRDKALIEDIYRLKRILPPHSGIKTSEKIFYHYYEIAYFARYSSLYLSLNDQIYYLNLAGETIPRGYQRENTGLIYFQLSRLKKLPQSQNEDRV